MNITFIEDCPPVAQTGWSAYAKGARATLRAGAHLVEAGIAYEGWGQKPKPEIVTPAPQKQARQVTPEKRTRKTRGK